MSGLKYTLVSSNGVLTDIVMYTRFHSDTQLCTYTVSSTDKYRIFITSRFKVEDSAEAAYLSIGTRATSSFDKGFDNINELVSCID